jgi:hypothetical protein
VRDRCLLRIGIKRVRDDDLLIHRLSQLTVALESVREGLTDETGDLARRVDEAMSSLQPALEALTDP